MTGSKRQLRQGVWELRVSLGRDPTTGKYKQLSRTYHGDAAGADEALRALVETEVPRLRNAANGHARPAGDEPGPRDDQVAGAGPAAEADAIRQLLAALPLEAGECVVGWSADRAVTAFAGPEAEYSANGAAVYRLVQLHRLRRHGAAGPPDGPARRSVWVPRDLVEHARPALGHDCAIHVWTL